MPRILKRFLVVIWSTAVFAAGAPVDAREISESTLYEQRATTHGQLGPDGVTPVLNRFLLMRKGSAVCAIRFTGFRRQGTPGRETRFTSGDNSTFAEYDWYFQGDGSFDLRKPNVTMGHGKLHWGADRRLGHGLILTRPKGANRAVECGNFAVWWGYPMNLAFFSFVGEQALHDPELEFSLTKWRDISEIDASGSRLRWVNSRTTTRQEVWIPMEELP